MALAPSAVTKTKSADRCNSLRLIRDEQGIALVIALIAVSMFSAIAFYLSFNSAVEIRISDNFESHMQARYAALAGMNRARDAIRGLTNYNTLLTGPDGTYNNSATYLTQARAFSFRNPLTWSLARTVDIDNPTITGVADDGMVNAGGTVLIPLTGIALTATNPYGSGAITTARYFVKVTDNNGEAAEIAADPANNPFVDGDGIIIMRSMGIARTIRETAGGTVRSNSAVVLEARFSSADPLTNLGSPVVIIGSQLNANFSGNAFKIYGGSSGPGIATIDTNTSDAYSPSAIIEAAAGGKGTITGNCTGATANSCIGDITTAAMADPQKAKLADPNWLYNFVYTEVPKFADQTWDGTGTAPTNLGTVSHPLTTLITGNASFTGRETGAGLLIVNGDLELGGQFHWDGLILAVGSGHVWFHGMNDGIHGGIITSNVSMVGGVPTFGAATFVDIRGNSRISDFDNGLWSLGSGLIPPQQFGLREVTSNIDP